MPLPVHALPRLALALIPLVLGACATDRSGRDGGDPVAAAAPASAEERSWSRSLGDVAGQMRQVPRWEHYPLPGKQETRYDYVRDDGRVAVRATSESSASMLRTHMEVAPELLGNMQFSWKVSSLIATADLGVRETDDAPARVVLAFDGDRSRFTVRESAMAELARAVTGEEMPYATLMYVWCNHRPPGAVIVHPRSARVRSIVVESGPGRLGQWTAYQRDVRADFERAFGEAPGKLTGVALMTDSDNTRTQARAWYGPLRFDSTVAQTSSAAP
ncbi:DUF3047 domain-containing protein [Xylophilus rhododendri]|uniref:DUF3047 domain-containing protein n=1 Tax=Xylophilus rhododendri TaxID=2697032 RepID=A0A857J2X8_9BURK|nr:DUF3047 domain-containing protein [Xylophilus rhododendri]QHI98290.1 DUF3047 domain-containing protein [Xylophilus rhododendri]